jgi:hypothetical protein
VIQANFYFGCNEIAPVITTKRSFKCTNSDMDSPFKMKVRDLCLPFGFLEITLVVIASKIKGRKVSECFSLMNISWKFNFTLFVRNKIESMRRRFSENINKCVSWNFVKWVIRWNCFSKIVIYSGFRGCSPPIYSHPLTPSPSFCQTLPLLSPISQSTNWWSLYNCEIYSTQNIYLCNHHYEQKM